MPYPTEAVFTVQEQEIIFRIRQLISDTKEVFVDDVPNVNACGKVTASGTMYQLDEPKGYPLNVFVNDIEYTTSGNPQILGYKYLKFATSVLVSGASLTVIYEHFNHSDLEIIDTYDSSSTTYLIDVCNLTIEDIGPDLLLLATAYILISKDLQDFIRSAVNLEDSDSRFDASKRPQYLNDLLKRIGDQLKSGIEAATKCKMLSLPVYKVE